MAVGVWDESRGRQGGLLLRLVATTLLTGVRLLLTITVLRLLVGLWEPTLHLRLVRFPPI